MGGALILVSIVLTTLLWADLSNRLVWVVLLVTLAFGTIGWIDDYRKVVQRNPKGLSPRAKFFWQSMIGLAAAAYLAYIGRNTPALNELIVPFFKFVAYPLGPIGFIVLTFFVIVGTSNAVNLTDGLDGLAIGPIVMAGGAFAIIAYLSGNFRLAEYLRILNVKGTGELAIFCAALVGAALGFLWFNSYPAQVFMGDVGSLALGGLAAALAIATHTQLLLVILGGIFVLETASVILQVVSFRLFRRRLFRMAPIHHHFEVLGWHEFTVIVRFWIVSSPTADAARSPSSTSPGSSRLRFAAYAPHTPA